MAKSTRQLILEALTTRLAAIDGRPPFQTEIGNIIFTHEAPELGPDDPGAAVAVIVEPDAVQWQKQNVLVDLPVMIGALVRVHGAAWAKAFETAEAGVADIKRAIELADRRLGIDNVDSRGIKRGATSIFERPTGSVTVGLGVEYTISYVEGWGTP
jgi:hypothetical protein